MARPARAGVVPMNADIPTPRNAPTKLHVGAADYPPWESMLIDPYDDQWKRTEHDDDLPRPSRSFESLRTR